MSILPRLRRGFASFGQTRRQEHLHEAVAVAPPAQPRIVDRILGSSSRAIHRNTVSPHHHASSLGGRALDATQTGLRIAHGVVADVAPGPMVSVPLQAVAAIIEIVQTIRSNKEDCQNLAREVLSYEEVLSRCEEKDFIEQDLYALQKLHDQLDVTLSVLQGIADQKLLARIIYNQRNKSAITQCRERLASVFRHFMPSHQIPQNVGHQRKMPFLLGLRHLLAPLGKWRRHEALNEAAVAAPPPGSRIVDRILGFSSSDIYHSMTSVQRRAPSLNGRAFDATQTGLRIAHSVIGDIAPAIMVNTPLQAVSAIVEIAQTLRSNNKDCQNLAREVLSYEEVLLHCEEKCFIEQNRHVLQELRDQLNDTLGVLQGIADQNFFARMIHDQRNKSAIAQCRERLASAFHHHTLSRNINHQCTLTCVQESQQSLWEMNAARTGSTSDAQRPRAPLYANCRELSEGPLSLPPLSPPPLQTVQPQKTSILRRLRRGLASVAQTNRRKHPNEAIVAAPPSKPRIIHRIFGSPSRAIHRSVSSVRRRVPSVGGTALNATQAGLKIAQGVVGDLAPGPVVSIPLQAVSAIVEIAQTIRSNKDGCQNLSREVVSYEEEVMSRCEEKDVTERELYALQELQDQLNATLSVLQGIASQKLAARTCYNQRNKSAIAQCRERMDSAFRKYMMSQSNNIHRTLNAMAAHLYNNQAA